MNSVIALHFFKWGYKKKRPLITTVVLLIMISSIAFQSVSIYTIVQGPKKMGELADSTAQQKESPQMKHDDFHLIFGFSNRQDIKEQTSEIPITKLGLVLRGAMAGLEDQKYSSAIIQSANQDKLYEVGDKLPGGAMLNQVFPDHIVIKRGTQLEKLYFPDASKDSRAFQEYRQPTTGRFGAHEQLGYDNYQNDKALEERMQELRERLQQ